MAFPIAYSLTVLIAALLIRYTVQYVQLIRRRKGGGSFPGPTGVPILGRVWDIPRFHSYLRFKEWTNKYGPIWQMTLFGHNHIWLGSERIANELLSKRNTIYSDRPQIPNLFDSKGAGAYLPLLGHNSAWKRQRKFIHGAMSWSISNKHLNAPYEESKQLLAEIIDKPLDYEEILDGYVGRVVSRICFGTPNHSMELLHYSYALLNAISPSHNLNNVALPLNYLPYWLSPWKKFEKKRIDAEREFFFRLRDEVVRGAADRSSFTGIFFDSKGQEMDPDEAAYSIGMTALAGMLTTASIMINYIVAMCHFPDWQTAIQDEVDTVVGDRMVEATDSPNLPVLRAVIKELVRWRPIVPGGIPHENEQDDWYEGVFIPAGTRLHPFGWGISREPELYPDPEAFNPKRWLEPQYPTFKEPLSQYPNLKNSFMFGYGRRTCMGIDLVETELLVVLGNLAWSCNFHKVKGMEHAPVPCPPQDYTPQLISRPRPFPFDLAPRSEKKGEAVRRNWHKK